MTYNMSLPFQFQVFVYFIIWGAFVSFVPISRDTFIYFIGTHCPRGTLIKRGTFIYFGHNVQGVLLLRGYVYLEL